MSSIITPDRILYGGEYDLRLAEKAEHPAALILDEIYDFYMRLPESVMSAMNRLRVTGITHQEEVGKFAVRGVLLGRAMQSIGRVSLASSFEDGQFSSHLTLRTPLRVRMNLDQGLYVEHKADRGFLVDREHATANAKSQQIAAPIPA